jgi:hypothetical protein
MVDWHVFVADKHKIVFQGGLHLRRNRVGQAANMGPVDPFSIV